VLLLLPLFSRSQSYEKLADSALHVMWEGKDSISASIAYPKAYDLYQQAFQRYPKEVSSVGLYKAGVLAAELGHKQQAFIYLNKAVDQLKWNMILGKNASGEFKSLVTDRQWPLLVQKAKTTRDSYLKRLQLVQQNLEQQSMFKKLKLKKVTAKAAYRLIKNYKNFPDIKDQYLSFSLKLNDSLQTPYLIALPKNYKPGKKYTMLIFLHGAVLNNTSFPEYSDSSDTGGWNRFYTKYADKNEVIMVYPNGNKQFNWMKPDLGFFMVPAIVKEIKQVINVDDDRVFITGHSNGATGSFSYLLKQPSLFAGFYGFNTRPTVATGGTYLRNILNRSYFNVSTDQDYYYPPEANDSLAIMMKHLGADYQDHRYNGFPHWFPAFPESEKPHELLFLDLEKRKRNPFQGKIYWEYDDLKYGRCDWLSITSFDTLSEKASWQKDLNFGITKWKKFDSKDSLITRDTLMKAFKYIRKSGAVRGSYTNNCFKIETSAVKSFSVYISPEMVDLNKSVQIIVNGKLKFQGTVDFKKEILLEEFNKSADRRALWVNRVDITL
jgi:predicted esterase